MNIKIIKQRFVDFKLKMDVWKQREKQRIRIKKSYKRHTEKLRSILDEKKSRFTIENELVHQCATAFDNI